MSGVAQRGASGQVHVSLVTTGISMASGTQYKARKSWAERCVSTKGVKVRERMRAYHRLRSGR